MFTEETSIEEVRACKMTVSSGEKTISTVQFEVPLTPQLASLFDSWTLLFHGDNSPRTGYTKLRLDIDRIKKVRLRSGLDWPGHPFEANPISLSCFDVKQTKEGRMLYFNARFDSYAIAVFDFVNEAGEDAFTLRVGPAAGEVADTEDAAEPPAPEPTAADLDSLPDPNDERESDDEAPEPTPEQLDQIGGLLEDPPEGDQPNA